MTRGSEKENKKAVPTEEEEQLGLFQGRTKPDYKIGWELYCKGVQYNEQINLDKDVRAAENFYIGKQWEGVESGGLPTPSVNFIKRGVGFTVATITSDNIKVTAEVMSNAVGKKELRTMVKYINDEFAAINERNSLEKLTRIFVRNAAVDGDGCLYAYWDADAKTGQKYKGQIKYEVLDNMRVYFGTPQIASVQDQEYIIITKRLPSRKVRLMAKRNGIDDWSRIIADNERSDHVDTKKLTDDMTTVCTMFWKDDDTGHVWKYEYTSECDVSEPVDTDLMLYPLVWLNWDNIHDSYHGQSMVTSLIPNQIAVNRTIAMAIVSNDRAAYPTKIFDSTRIKKMTNRVGAAIPMQGGDVNTVVKILDGAPVSPQIFQFIDSIKTNSEESIGATAVAMGDTRPDNTSAIIALQRAAATPNEMTKLNINAAIEELHRIALEFIGAYYGKRFVEAELEPREEEALQFAAPMLQQQGIDIPESKPIEYDFSQIKDHEIIVTLEAGASTYYSEVAAVTTLQNFLNLGVIDIVDVLKRIPDNYIPDRLGLISDINKRKNEQMQMQMQMQQQMQPNIGVSTETSDALTDQQKKPDIPEGAGYSNLQRTINRTGTTEGVI